MTYQKVVSMQVSIKCVQSLLTIGKYHLNRIADCLLHSEISLRAPEKHAFNLREVDQSSEKISIKLSNIGFETDEPLMLLFAECQLGAGTSRRWLKALLCVNPMETNAEYT